MGIEALWKRNDAINFVIKNAFNEIIAELMNEGMNENEARMLARKNLQHMVDRAISNT